MYTQKKNERASGGIDCKDVGSCRMEGVRTTAELLAARARQLERRKGDLEKAAESVKESRLYNTIYFDSHRKKRLKPLEAGDLVLLHNTRLTKQ